MTELEVLRAREVTETSSDGLEQLGPAQSTPGTETEQSAASAAPCRVPRRSSARFWAHQCMLMPEWRPPGAYLPPRRLGGSWKIGAVAHMGDRTHDRVWRRSPGPDPTETAGHGGPRVSTAGAGGLAALPPRTAAPGPSLAAHSRIQGGLGLFYGFERLSLDKRSSVGLNFKPACRNGRFHPEKAPAFAPCCRGGGGRCSLCLPWLPGRARVCKLWGLPVPRCCLGPSRSLSSSTSPVSGGNRPFLANAAELDRRTWPMGEAL